MTTEEYGAWCSHRACHCGLDPQSTSCGVCALTDIRGGCRVKPGMTAARKSSAPLQARHCGLDPQSTSCGVCALTDIRGGCRVKPGMTAAKEPVSPTPSPSLRARPAIHLVRRLRVDGLSGWMPCRARHDSCKDLVSPTQARHCGLDPQSTSCGICALTDSRAGCRVEPGMTAAKEPVSPTRSPSLRARPAIHLVRRLRVDGLSGWMPGRARHDSCKELVSPTPSPSLRARPAIHLVRRLRVDGLSGWMPGRARHDSCKGTRLPHSKPVIAGSTRNPPRAASAR
jgi:hypothetical protein